MHKEYKHPAPYRPEQDYLTGMRAANAHIKGITMNGPHPGQAQHLGGMASYHDHLQELHYGEAHAMKKELKRVIDYLYYYANTGHSIYKFLAEDALMHVEQLQAEITDESERAHAMYFLESVKEYMSWLKPEQTGMGTASGGNGVIMLNHDQNGGTVTL